MSHSPQVRIRATYMRGGTSKGTFFSVDDLPERAREPGSARDQFLLRVVGSPDPYGKQIDGMGGATSSTSKAVLLSRSTRPEHDVDYLFGQVSIDQPFVDWSGNCGNLSAAVGPFAIRSGLIDGSRLVRDGIAIVRIWQQNIGKTIVAHVPMAPVRSSRPATLSSTASRFRPRKSNSNFSTLLPRKTARAVPCFRPAGPSIRWTCPASAPSRRR